MNHSTTIAPSESHLEQWIIENPARFGYPLPGVGFCKIIDHVFASQYGLPSGIADIIGTAHSTHMRVVELKKREIDAKAIAQILRYISDLQVVAELAVIDQYDRGEITFEEYKVLAPHNCISGVVVGHEMLDRHILTACDAVNIHVVAYRYTGDGYEFECLSESRAMQTQRISHEYDRHVHLRQQFDRLQASRRALLNKYSQGAK